MIYVMSDLHGEYVKFLKMLDVIGFSDEDILYILGDVIDRGEDSIKLLRYIISKPNMKMILGNHEQMMVQTLKFNNFGMGSCWMKYGGSSTLSQFQKLTINQQNKILDYLRYLPIYRILDKYILVHAGIDPFISMANNMMISEFMVMQSYDVLLWDRNEAFFRSPALSKYTVIFGHTPTHYITNVRNPMVIWNGMGKIGIDCGACFKGGQLACLRLNDMKEFYVLG